MSATSRLRPGHRDRLPVDLPQGDAAVLQRVVDHVLQVARVVGWAAMSCRNQPTRSSRSVRVATRSVPGGGCAWRSSLRRWRVIRERVSRSIPRRRQAATTASTSRPSTPMRAGSGELVDQWLDGRCRQQRDDRRVPRRLDEGPRDLARLVAPPAVELVGGRARPGLEVRRLGEQHRVLDGTAGQEAVRGRGEPVDVRRRRPGHGPCSQSGVDGQVHRHRVAPVESLGPAHVRLHRQDVPTVLW